MRSKTPLWVWDQQPPIGPPDGYIMAPNGALVPISKVEMLSRARMALPPEVGPPDWRHDPSYFWVEITRRRREQRR